MFGFDFKRKNICNEAQIISDDIKYFLNYNKWNEYKIR